MKELSKYIKQLLRLALPGREGSKSFIIDASNPLSSDTIGTAYSIEIMSDVSGFAATDTSIKGGADYPTEITAGYITFGNFTSIEITDGIIKAYLV